MADHEINTDAIPQNLSEDRPPGSTSDSDASQGQRSWSRFSLPETLLNGARAVTQIFSYRRGSCELDTDKVFVAFPGTCGTYENGKSVLSWVFSNFPQDKTKIILTCVVTSTGLLNLRRSAIEAQADMVLNEYLTHCSMYKFQAEKLVHTANNVAKGILEVIAKHGTKNLVMRSAANSDMTALTSATANKVMQEADQSCKLWFVFDGNLICTREVNSDNLTPAPTSVERSHWNGQSNQVSSIMATRSTSESRAEEGNIDDVDASLIEMLHEASVEADSFEKKSEEILEAHKKIAEETSEAQKKMAGLVMKLAKKLEEKEQEIRGVREILQGEKQENDQLRQQIEENEQEIEQIKIENDLLKSQRDEYSNQMQVANERRFALEKQVSESELVIKDLTLFSASSGDRIDYLRDELFKLQHERDTLVGQVEELSNQRESTHSGSSTALNSEFSLQELQQATQNFSESLKIGQGGFGPVYKGSLRQTTVAIKLLHSESLQGVSQFHQEITILTKVRHPNLVNLIGACSEKSALVYEYLSNGSLEDRLTCANGTPPLTWQARTRIIGEICLALIFLHSNRPHLVVHGDLKPQNILLDTNLVSKLSDFGISRLLKQPDSNSTAVFQTNSPLGTFAYMDPEYLSTGILTPKSDTYSFGIIILRLLTGKPPMNIARKVQDAMRSGVLLSVIDESAGTWPFEQAKQLAKIALRCVELSRIHRPDLVNDVWTVVEPLMKAAATYVERQGRESIRGEERVPSHFICPISQEVMQEPYIAADGFTYEKDAMKEWLSRGHSTSPMTNLVLAHRNLIPNLVLRSAIQEWLQNHPQCS